MQKGLELMQPPNPTAGPEPNGVCPPLGPLAQVGGARANAPEQVEVNDEIRFEETKSHEQSMAKG